MGTSVSSGCLLDEMGTSVSIVSSVCLLDDTGIISCTLRNPQRKQKGTQTFKEILPKSGFLYTEETSEMVRQQASWLLDLALLGWFSITHFA